jgi:hypothetical protein
VNNPKLCEALVKFQAAVRPAQKNAVNPHLKNKYANLESVFEAIRQPMSDYGLAIVQAPSMADGQLMLTTTIVHTSGESISQTMAVPMADVKIQSIGSALTYLRRYMASSMLGVVTGEDDDGEAVQRAEPVATVKPRPEDKATLECIANATTLVQLTELFDGLDAGARARVKTAFSARRKELGL